MVRVLRHDIKFYGIQYNCFTGKYEKETNNTPDTPDTSTQPYRFNEKVIQTPYTQEINKLEYKINKLEYKIKGLERNDNYYTYDLLKKHKKYITCKKDYIEHCISNWHDTMRLVHNQLLNINNSKKINMYYVLVMYEQKIKNIDSQISSFESIKSKNELNNLKKYHSTLTSKRDKYINTFTEWHILMKKNQWHILMKKNHILLNW